MSAAALNLLMMNYNNQNDLQMTDGAVSQHAQNYTYMMQSAFQQHQDYPENAIMAPTGSPVRQLKRLHPGATNTATELLRCRRRIDMGPYGYTGLPHPGAASSSRQMSSVARRNERERNRVRLVNHGFAQLRQHVPSTAGRSKKMSKVDTLKAAVDYIQQLRDVLEDADSAASSNDDASSTTSSSPSSYPEGSLPALSPASSASGSCPDGSRSPGGYSSDDASSTSSSSMAETRRPSQRPLEADQDTHSLDLMDFASWFC